MNATPKRKERGLYQNERGDWCAELYDSEKKRKKKVCGSKAAAQEWLVRERAKVREGKLFPEKVRASSQSKVTVGDLVDRFQADLEANCRSVVGPTLSGRYLSEFFGKKPACKIKPEDIEAYKISRLNTGKKPATVNRDLARLKTLFNKAIRNELLDRNPMAAGKVRMLHEENQSHVYLLDHQEATLKETMRPLDWEIVEFAFLTGLRASNQFKLERKDVNLERKIITIKINKGRKVRLFHMGPRAAELVARILARHNSDWVFPSSKPDRPLSAHNFYGRVFRPAVLDAGFKDLCWHSLRHTYGTRCAMAGVDVSTLKDQMGHGSVKITERYMHHSPNHAKKMANLYG